MRATKASERKIKRQNYAIHNVRDSFIVLPRIFGSNLWKMKKIIEKNESFVLNRFHLLRAIFNPAGARLEHSLPNFEIFWVIQRFKVKIQVKIKHFFLNFFSSKWPHPTKKSQFRELQNFGISQNPVIFQNTGEKCQIFKKSRIQGIFARDFWPRPKWKSRSRKKLPFRSQFWSKNHERLPKFCYQYFYTRKIWNFDLILDDKSRILITKIRDFFGLF